MEEQRLLGEMVLAYNASGDHDDTLTNVGQVIDDIEKYLASAATPRTAEDMLSDTLARLATTQEPQDRLRDSLAAVVYALDAGLSAGLVVANHRIDAQILFPDRREMRWEV